MEEILSKIYVFFLTLGHQFGDHEKMQELEVILLLHKKRKKVIVLIYSDLWFKYFIIINLVTIY